MLLICYNNKVCLLSFAVCSKLWGCQGELFDMVNSTGSQRLLDWSYAGYMAGETPIPITPIVTSVLVSQSGPYLFAYVCSPTVHVCIRLATKGLCVCISLQAIKIATQFGCVC